MIIIFLFNFYLLLWLSNSPIISKQLISRTLISEFLLSKRWYWGFLLSVKRCLFINPIHLSVAKWCSGKIWRALFKKTLNVWREVENTARIISVLAKKIVFLSSNVPLVSLILVINEISSVKNSECWSIRLYYKSIVTVIITNYV